jgi:ABC-2 type transport system permease protein
MSEPTFSRWRKWRIGFNVAVAIVSALAVVAMVNYLAARHPFRYNWSESAGSKLSPLTTRVLSNLGTNKVKIIVFFIPKEPLFSQVASVVKDYQAAAPSLDVEFVDYRIPGRANRIRADYGIAMGDGSRVIFDSHGKSRSVALSELSDFSFQDGAPRRTAFKGEQLFTAAIVNVTSARKLKAYFLSGHGELSYESNDDNSGYSRFARLLNSAGVDEVAEFDSLHGRDVPEDCSLLIIAGPNSRFTKEELERLDRYLIKGGRLFVAFPLLEPRRPTTGLEELLARWNVDVGLNVVSDKVNSEVNTQQAEVVVNKFGAHPITKPLLQSQIDFILPRSIGSKAIGTVRADAPKTTELVFTSDKGVAQDVDENRHATRVRKGSIPLAVAVEKGGIQGVAADPGATRIFVAGSSVSFSNGGLTFAANPDFATLAINWLLNRDTHFMEIPPRAITEYRLSVTEKQMTTLRWIFIAAAPGAALLIGGIVWLKRRI